MPAKIFIFDQVKKLMGWCPNAKKLESINQNNFSIFEAYDQSGKENSNVSKASDKLSRLDIQLFLFPFFFTPIYINLFQKGINTEAFLLGLSLSLPIYLLGWKKQMHQYNAVKEKPVISPSFRKTLACVVLFLFLGITLLLAFLPYISPYFYLLNDQTLNSFVSGTLILIWGFYFQLIYWERKNHMKIYIKRENAQQKLYVLEEKGENYEP